MIRAGYYIIIVILLFPVFFSSQPALDDENFSQIISSDGYDKGYRYNIQGWVYIHIEGEPYERGYQYGYLASAEIVEMIQRWSNFGHKVKFMDKFIFKNQPDKYNELSKQWWDICRYKTMNTFLKQVPDEFVEEMRGMADGMKARGAAIFGRDIEFEDVVASQFVQEVWITLDYFRKGIHPIRDFFSGLKEILSGEIVNPHGHCNAFIATGDATSNGEIVVSHATIFPNYISERCNFIVDVQPSDGYRFVMTCPPGSLWSQEDWYQNDQGIFLTETELVPQGPWKTRRTIPKGVRSRKAIQYSDSINKVIQNLEDGNNGLIPNEWLIGDKKTGEIAAYEQGLHTQNFKKTDNGYYWSCNRVHNINLLSELTAVPKIFLRFYGMISGEKGYFTIDGDNVVWNDARAKKLIELGELYYGEIDTEIAKKIMAASPLPEPTTDCKITSSKLTENLGLIAFMGKANGDCYIPTKNDENMFHGVTKLPASGWVDVYPSNSKRGDLSSLNTILDDVLSMDALDNQKGNSKTLWQHDSNDLGNINYSSSVVSNDIVYTASSNGVVYALDAISKRQKWDIVIGESALEPVLSKDFVFFGTDKGLHALDKENGDIVWEKLVGRISSKPIVAGNYVITGCSNGEIYVFDVNTGNLKWSYSSLSDSAYVSELDGNNIFFVGSGKTCYAFDIFNEKKLWEFETYGLITSAPRRKGNNVYFGSWDGNVYALDATTGNKKWSYETGWGIDLTPDVSDGTVFVGSLDNNFYALDAENGEPLWYYNCKSAIHSNPVAYGDYVFFGCDDGRLYALSKENGALAWSFAPGYYITDEDVNNYITTPIVSNPYVEDGVVYIGIQGTVYALDAQTFEKPEIEEEEKPEFDYTNLVLIISLIVVMLLFLLLYIFKKKDGAHKK